MLGKSVLLAGVFASTTQTLTVPVLHNGGLSHMVDDGLNTFLSDNTAPLAEQYYVRLRNKEDKSAVKAAIQELGGMVTRDLKKHDLMLTVQVNNANILNELRHIPEVQLVEAVPTYQRMQSSQDYVPFGIDLVRARQVWNFGEGTENSKYATKGTEDVVVCVIDDGIDPSHHDFAGVNFVNTNDVSEWTSCFGCNHGNHVSGTIVAQINDLGVVGVSPEVSIASVRVFNETHFTYPGGLIGALEDCEEMGARIVSMSLGGPFFIQSEKMAFSESPALCIASAGNSLYGNDYFSTPASYPSVISVAAVNNVNELADFSQRNDQVELAAPGVSVLSTVMNYFLPNLTSFLTEDPTKEVVSYPITVFDGSGSGTVIGPLLNTFSECLSGDLDAMDTSGRVCHCRRGSVSFASKVDVGLQAGCATVVISNNTPGSFAGYLGGETYEIPVLGLSLEDGQTLESLPNDGSVSLKVENEFTYPPYSDYQFYDGTSMACPHVSGVAALMMSAFPQSSNAQIRCCLQHSAKDLGPKGYDVGYGHGLVQADAALQCLIKQQCDSNGKPYRIGGKFRQ